jgi:hypothetical protein
MGLGFGILAKIPLALRRKTSLSVSLRGFGRMINLLQLFPRLLSKRFNDAVKEQPDKVNEALDAANEAQNMATITITRFLWRRIRGSCSCL